MTSSYKILAFATQGSGGDDESRLGALLSALPEGFAVEWLPFARGHKLRSAREVLEKIRGARPSLVVMEGSGIGGGAPLLTARQLFGTPYVVSSGDAIGPFVRSQRPWLGPAFDRYERMLYRGSAGYIGWTPYLAGRALAFGAPRAITAAGWAPRVLSNEDCVRERARVRARLGIPADAIVVGIAGSLAWNPRVDYCYGLELVQALRRCERREVRALIVGDGSGLEKLRGDGLEARVHLPGRIPREEIPAYLAAMDLASLPQSVDEVGAYRYTTKLSEYLAAGLPLVTGMLPFAYDLDSGQEWALRLPGAAPWASEYVDALTGFLDRVTREELVARAGKVPRALTIFDRDLQVRRVTELIREICLGLRP